MKTLLQQFIDAGIKMEEMHRHCSDLHVPITVESGRVKDTYEFRQNVTTFRSEVDNIFYYDIPFVLSEEEQKLFT